MGKVSKELIRCDMCHKDLPREDFWESRIWGKGGKSGRCKECCNKKRKQYNYSDAVPYQTYRVASLPDGYADEYELIVFGTPEDYLGFVNRISSTSGNKFADRKAGRGSKPKGLE